MKLKIFLSWSGERSKIIASKLSIWLPKIIQIANPWMSEEQIMKGNRWSEVIGRNLEEHNIGILCITPENLKSEWLNFEAGAISKIMGKSHVFPLLYGVDYKNFEGPLTQFQSTLLIKDDFFKLIQSLNNILDENKIATDILKQTFNFFWYEIEELLNELSATELKFNPSTLPKILSVISNYDLPEPLIENSVFFNEGFESHTLYQMITNISSKRLFNLSRLNRKLLDKEHWDFWKSLKKKIESGFELKLLFLDPDCPDYVLKASHTDPDFRNQIVDAIQYAKIIFSKFDLDISKHCKTYNTIRPFATTIIDEAILFTPLVASIEGTSKSLTKSSFTIIHSSSKLGIELIGDFNHRWQTGNTLVK